MAQLVKSVNSLAIASVKNIEGLAIASAKSIMGLDNTSAGIAVDASSPIRWTGNGQNNTNIDSASFTAPANSFLVLCIEHDGGTGASDTGALTLAVSLTTGSVDAPGFVQQVARLVSETTAGGSSYIYTAIATTSMARVVRLNSQWATNPTNTVRRSCKLYVVTGADITGTPVDTVGANNEGGSTTNNLNTTSITPGKSGLLFAADCDWNASGVFTSSNLTLDTADYSGAISVCDGYRASTVAVGITANLDAGGAAACQHKWCQINVRIP